MNKKSWVSFVGIFVVSSAWAATDISRQAYLPEIPGLTIQGEIPSEFTRRNESSRIVFSISSQDLAETLAKAGLPPLSERTLLPKTVAQCAVSNATRHGTYELVVTDAEWLSHQSGWCRAARKLFKTCEPKSPAEIATLAKVRKTSDETAVGPSEIQVIEPASCVSDRSSENDHLDQLAACAASNEPHACADSFVSPGSNLAPLADGEWKVRLSLSSSRDLREVREPLHQQIVQDQTLVALKIAGIDFAQDTDGLWSGSISASNALAFFTDSSAKFAIEAGYQVTRDGALYERPSRKGVITASVRAANVDNLPLSVTLSKPEILGLEEFTDRQTLRAKAGALRDACQRSIQNPNVRLTPFGEFMCIENGAGLIDVAASHTQVRLRFADQRGVERLLVWDHPAPAADCTIETYSFTCSVPGQGWYGDFNREAAQEWLQSSFPSRLRRMIQDPTYDEQANVTFPSLLSFLPRAEGAPALTTLVTFQAQEGSFTGMSNKSAALPLTTAIAR